MPDESDMDLLRAYREQGSGTAFAELVQRHIALVYSVALRRVGNPAQAEEITQAVFIILARKAGALRAGTVLEGWLYETARLTALSFLRGERRRQFREQEAYMQSTQQETADDSVWQQLAPLLDEGMARLRKKDRDAIVLRFFKERSVREVAGAMQVSEAAAQRRVLRALEKLRKYFVTRGVGSTAAAIAGAISAHSVHAAPPAFANSVTAVALAKGATASISTLTLIKGALKLMAWTKAKTTVTAGLILILAAGTTTVVVKNHHHAPPRSSWTAADIQRFEAETARRVNSAKLAGLACFVFAKDHRGQWPENFAQLTKEPANLRDMDSNWEFVSSGNEYHFKDPSQTVLFREKQSRPSPDGKFIKLYALADGSVQTVASPDEDFTGMEKKFGFSYQRAVK